MRNTLLPDFILIFFTSQDKARLFYYCCERKTYIVGHITWPWKSLDIVLKCTLECLTHATWTIRYIVFCCNWQCEQLKLFRNSYVSKNVKLQQADFLINISSLDILKTLLHRISVDPDQEGITVLNFLSADANMCLHKVCMRITAVRHIFHHSWRMHICCKNTSGALSTKKSTYWV